MIAGTVDRGTDTRTLRSGSSILRRSASVSAVRHCSRDGRDQQHVRAVLVGAHVEVLVNMLAQDARCERTEGFPELDADVHLLLHPRRARRRR